MVPNDLISALVIQDQGVGDPLQFGSVSKLGTINAAVKHECGRLSGFSNLSPQVSSDSSRTDLTSIVQRQFNGYAAEEVVKEHSVSNVTPSRLEEKMNMLY